MASPLEQLEELIQMLRDNGVTCYQEGGLTLYIDRPATQGSASLASAVNPGEHPVETQTVGYKHPSLRLFSWPESKEGPK